jgi:hypothetical protein
MTESGFVDGMPVAETKFVRRYVLNKYSHLQMKLPTHGVVGAIVSEGY